MTAQGAAAPILWGRWRESLPGLLASTAVAVAAWACGAGETVWLGRSWLEPVVLAIVIGAAVRTLAGAPSGWTAGVSFSAKWALEVAIVLLGASVSAAAIAAVGPALLGGLVLVVALALAAGYGLGRLFGLSHTQAALVACGNAICGNSAIAAVAPAVGAKREEVCAAIAFTAVLGVAAVLVLPLLAPVLGLNALGYGALAGLTVYAVPQVLAATAPIGPAAVQSGALVKLARVMLLGPVVAGAALINHRGAPQPLSRLVPWYIVGFAALAGARAAGWLAADLMAPMAGVCSALTLVAMAALGLSTDLRSAARSGGRIALSAAAALAVLFALSLALVKLTGQFTP